MFKKGGNTRKVADMMKAYEAFKTLGEKELPFKAALTVAENIETLRVPAEVASRKRREITEKHLERDKEGNPIKMGEDAYKLKDSASYSKEMKELDEEETKIGDIKNIPKDILSGLTIAPVKLAPILEYIK